MYSFIDYIYFGLLQFNEEDQDQGDMTEIVDYPQYEEYDDYDPLSSPEKSGDGAQSDVGAANYLAWESKLCRFWISELGTTRESESWNACLQNFLFPPRATT